MTLRFLNMTQQLTKAESRILDYITNNTETFLFMSIGQLARDNDTSEATVSRFVRHVGCKNYKELKQRVMEQAALEGPAAKMVQTLTENDSFSLEGWMHKQQCYLEKTLESLDDKVFRQAVTAVLSARRVFIHAKSASAALGRLLSFRLRRLGIETILLPSGGSEVLEGLAQVHKDDLVIMFSFSKVSYEGEMILQCQKDAGYTTLAFTSRTFIPDAQKADINVFVYRGPAKEYHSISAPAAVVDALVVAVSEQMGPESARHLSRLYEIKKKYSYSSR